jgi:hypothetical protein
MLVEKAYAKLHGECGEERGRESTVDDDGSLL